MFKVGQKVKIKKDIKLSIIDLDIGLRKDDIYVIIAVSADGQALDIPVLARIINVKAPHFELASTKTSGFIIDLDY